LEVTVSVVEKIKGEQTVGKRTAKKLFFIVLLISVA
jgi:hypothetical protein